MDDTPLGSFLAHGDFVYRHELVPVFSKASGPILEDINGYKYFDAEAANGTAVLGFDNSILKEALKDINDLPSIPSFCETKIRLKVAEKLAKKINEITGVNGKIAFELGGAQGLELALKVVKSNTKKSQFVVFQGGYHGRSIFTSQLSASHRYRSLMGDWRIPVVRLPYPDYEQSGSLFDNPDKWTSYTLDNIKRLVETETGGMAIKSGDQDVAALILEPMLNAGGIVKPPAKFINEVVKIFKKLGAIIVVDEIFCGFYRTGKMFGFQHYNFTPDVIVLSKALTNGVTPLSAVWARDKFMSNKNFPPGTHSATYINNPLAMAVANVVLDRYFNWKTIDKDIKTIETSLQQTIDTIVKTSKLAKSGFALGGVGRILLNGNYAGKILDIARIITRNNPIDGIHGLILASTGMTPNVVAINPPLVLTSKERKILNELLVLTFKKADEVIKNNDL